MLKTKNEQIKELKEILYKINELSKIKNDALNEKVEQGKINAEITNNNINDNSKEGQDKKEINEKLENKNGVKEDNINNKKNYENQGETTEKELGETNDGNNEKKKDKNLNNKDNNSNDFITPFGSTPTGNQDIHIDISQENENRGQENNNNTEDNTKNLMNIKNNYLTSKIPVQSRNVQQSNIIQNRNQNGSQNNAKNNNINNLNNNIFKPETFITKSKYQNNSKNNQNESINKTIDKKAAKEKYKKELDKLRKDIPDLLEYFSDDYLLEALSKNNGDINKLEEYLFNYLIEYQKKTK